MQAGGGTNDGAPLLDHVSTHGDGLLKALETLGYGGLILDDNGHVVLTNERAKRYLGWHMELRYHASGDDREINKSLQSALRSALRASSDQSPEFGYILAVPRGTKRPLLLRSVQLANGTPDHGTPTTAIVLIDLDECPQPDESLLRQAFGLTPAESRLAKRLAGGDDLASIADALGVGIGTLRFQLKAIFWKTGTRRQAELVALLAHMARLKTG